MFSVYNVVFTILCIKAPLAIIHRFVAWPTVDVRGRWERRVRWKSHRIRVYTFQTNDLFSSRISNEYITAPPLHCCKNKYSSVVLLFSHCLSFTSICVCKLQTFFTFVLVPCNRALLVIWFIQKLGSVIGVLFYLCLPHCPSIFEQRFDSHFRQEWL